jgi:hypothetical protein
MSVSKTEELCIDIHLYSMYFLSMYYMPNIVLENGNGTTNKVDKSLPALPSVEAHICNPNTWEAETGRLQIPGHPGLHSESPFQKTKDWGCNSVGRVSLAYARL